MDACRQQRPLLDPIIARPCLACFSSSLSSNSLAKSSSSLCAYLHDRHYQSRRAARLSHLHDARRSNPLSRIRGFMSRESSCGVLLDDEIIGLILYSSQGPRPSCCHSGGKDGR